MQAMLTRILVTIILCVAGSGAVLAQAFPTKPIRLIIPVPPGGGTDFFARTVAAKLGQNLGQSIVIDNRPGGSTFIAVSALTSAPPDGHTLLISSETTYSTNPSLHEKLPYDPEKSFAYITRTARFVFLLVANPSVPVSSVKELVTLLKSRPPRSVNYASPGPGSGHHLAMALFEQSTQTQLTHVPYKGAGPAVVDLVGGEIPLMFLDVATAAPHIKAGKLKALAVVNPERLASLPDVPTMAEAGLPGFEAGSWQGLVAPAGTPAAVVQRLNAEFERVLQDPAVRQRLTEAGIEPQHSTAEAFVRYASDERSKWATVIRGAGIPRQ